MKNSHSTFSVACTLAMVFATSGASAQDKPKSEIPADTEIKTTASGLKYSVLKAGKGAKPGVGDQATVNYTGWLTDGTKFDSSRGKTPFSFTIGQGVIKGWSEGVQLMPVGSQFKFTIPAALGYGKAGSGTIPPDATLVFEVELLSIKSFPKFRKANPKLQKKTESGILYESVKATEGKTFTEGKIFKLNYAIFSPEGRLIECTEKTGRTITGTPKDMRLKFLKEAPSLMQLGSRYRFEVPKELGIPGMPTSVWELELIAILEPLPVPEFSKSAKDKLMTTKSGLQYEVIKEGKGESPNRSHTVSVNYAGWLESGKLFDSSFGRGEPSELSLSRVIKGWSEGMALMKPGGITKFTIPSNLAYGPKGSGSVIPPTRR